MNDSRTRPRRSLVVVLLDAVLRLTAAFHAGGTPTPKVREAGARRGLGRYLLMAGVVVALAGTALLVVVLVRAPANQSPPPGQAGALPGLQSQPAEPSAALSALPGPVDPTATPSVSKSASARVTTKPASAGGKVPITESVQVPLTASYRTSSVTAGLLGYRMTVTVENPGASPKDGWALTVTLPRSTLRVTGVDGGTAAQDGSEWSFTPDASTSRVPAGGSVELAFDVNGATLLNAAPQDCTIDGNSCGD